MSCDGRQLHPAAHITAAKGLNPFSAWIQSLTTSKFLVQPTADGEGGAALALPGDSGASVGPGLRRNITRNHGAATGPPTEAQELPGEWVSMSAHKSGGTVLTSREHESQVFASCHQVTSCDGCHPDWFLLCSAALSCLVTLMDVALSFFNHSHGDAS